MNATAMPISIPSTLGPVETRHELELSVGTRDGHVVVEFGTPISWLALPPDVATDLAIALHEGAEMMET